VAELQRLFIAGRLATTRWQYVRAATLFGLADLAHHHIHRIYRGPILPLVDAALVSVRVALGPTVFAKAFAAGQQLSLDEAFATILSPRHVAGAPTMG
jgi:hypothetical protein